MNKKIFYWIIGLIVIVILVVWMFVGRSTKAPNEVEANVARQTIHDLITSGVTQTCTFSIAATATSSSLTGTVYMDSGKMRGDFVKTDLASKVTNAHMIVTDGMSYLWSDSLSNGVKAQETLVFNSTTLSERVGIDMNQPTIYSCTSQTPDQSQFTLPTNIKFTDVSRLLNK
jgi:heme/copper-type cytochrome/quinol oxidase subunit 2